MLTAFCCSDSNAVRFSDGDIKELSPFFGRSLEGGKTAGSPETGQYRYLMKLLYKRVKQINMSSVQKRKVNKIQASVFRTVGSVRGVSGK